MLHIFIDADACPVKQEVYRVARRYRLAVTLVAGMRMRIPEEPDLELVVVGQNPDAADDWIVDHVEADDIVITGDIPLAARCLAKQARVLGNTGNPFTPDNIGPLLATRNLLAHLREGGEVHGGPRPFEPRDRSRFLRGLDETVNQIRRGSS